MKLKIAALFILGAFVFTSCNKKQCPAYGQIDDAQKNETVKA